MASLRFIPSRVEGLADVTEVIVHPDRMDIRSAGELVTFGFSEVARWPRPAWLWKLLFRLGWRRIFLPVADRDWFNPNEGKFFAFYTQPRVVIYMPADSPDDYRESHFRRIQDVMASGGFSSYDLG